MKLKPIHFSVLLLAALAWGVLPPAQIPAEEKEKPAKKAGESGADADKEEVKKKTVAELTKDADKIDGLFTLYRDRKKGTAYLAIRKNQLDKEYIYFTHTRDGIPALGHFRGNFHDTRVFTIARNYERIEFAAENTAFYFDKKSPLKRASQANITRAVLASQPILAEDEKRGIVLIDAGKVFLTEAFHKVSPSKRPDDDKKGDRFTLGTLNKEKTKFRELRNYPENSVFVVEYVYDNPDPKKGDMPEITDPRYVSIELQHTLIQMPRNGYKPRYDDPRVGYFTQRVTDLTSASPTPYRDVIERWHLVKKNPDAELSEPEDPIVWWIENTTPRELRDTIREAGLLWNEAFETAGFKNAVVIKMQPDDAKWDADDIRYNVLRWTSSPSPPFGGYGPSFVNPRTGQILGADIMLEYVFVTNRLRYSKLFATAAFNRSIEGEAEGRSDGRTACRLGFGLQQNTLFGAYALKARGGGKVKVDTLMKESLHYLVLHEIGHTLGLMHNMKASQLHGPEAIHDRSVTEKEGLTGSVMDYPMLNFAPSGKKQGQYYQFRPGPYDHWAIEFGYSAPVKSIKEEAARLEKILSRSAEPALAFGNDADDMRSAGRGIDPRVMIGDMSSDAVVYAEERCALVNEMMGDLLEKAGEEGKSYHGVRDAYLILTGNYDDAVTAMSRYIGGVYVDRAFAGQKGGGAPFTAVPKAKQKRAMAALDRCLFSPSAFQTDAKLIRHLQQQRRGFDFFEANEDPRVHARVLEMQRNVLNHLLHVNVLTRIEDSALYGNDYSMAEVMGDLTGSIMRGDKGGKINSFRRQLQNHYVERLIAIAGLEDSSKYPSTAKSLALLRLVEIDKDFEKLTRQSGDTETKAHALYLTHRVKRAMEARK